MTDQWVAVYANMGKAGRSIHTHPMQSLWWFKTTAISRENLLVMLGPNGDWKHIGGQTVYTSSEMGRYDHMVNITDYAVDIGL